MNKLMSTFTGEIILKVVNAKKYKGILSISPHKNFLDLSAMCMAKIQNGYLPLTYNHLESYQMAEKEMWEKAKSSSQLDKISLQDILPVVSPMAVFRNDKDEMYGASVLLYPEIFENEAIMQDSDLIIFPSSIHEVIVCPKKMLDDSKLKELVGIVKEINASQVKNNERLSNSVYIYRKNTKKISIFQKGDDL